MVTMAAPPRRVGTGPRLPVLVSTEDACEFIGRPRTALYRWAREGRVRRYGYRGQRLWDLREMKDQAYIPPGDVIPPPPPVRYPPVRPVV